MAVSAFDPYEVLGIRPGASKDQIRAAYRDLVVRYHPDKHRGNPLEELAAAKLIEINRAYEVLSDDSKRAGHDARVQAPGREPQQTRPATVTAAPQPIMKLVNSVGLIISLVLFLRFGLGIARAVLMGLVSVMRMGPIFAIAIVVAIIMGGSYLMRARRK